MKRQQVPVFWLENVSYSYYGRYPALVEASLRVAPGERVVILGANGCGKSTLLKVLDGLVRPDAGRVEIFGEDLTQAAAEPTRLRALHRRVGLVFQDSDVQLFSPTVREDVAFGPLQMGWESDEVDMAVERALEAMEVAHLADRAPCELSEGEKRRAAIATVLALDPEVLLMDEPTAGLDPRGKALLLDLLARLSQEGRTLVATTQELEAAPHLGTRGVIFGDRERRPVADGPLLEVLHDRELLIGANLIHPGLGWTAVR